MKESYQLKKRRRLFYRWLEDNAIKDLYFDNLRPGSPIRNKIHWVHIYLLEDPYELLDCAFTWDATPQGHDFWSHYHDRLRNYWISLGIKQI